MSSAASFMSACMMTAIGVGVSYAAVPYMTPSAFAASAWVRYQNELALLPEGDGKELVAANCGACHSLRLVVQNHMPRAGWNQTIAWMQEKQNMWSLPPSIHAIILTYLATHLATPPAGLPTPLDFRPTNPLPEAIDSRLY